jgi:methyl-accepting chemotaxis protein
LLHAGDVLVGVAQETSASAKQTETGAVQQANLTYQLVNVVEELSQASHSAQNRLMEAAQGMQSCESSCTDASQEINKQVSDIGELAQDIASATKLAGELNEQSGEVGNVVKVIKEIAEQTNLLALNASIEAARAGESGRGFAVVAQEVRDLSIKTAESAERINSQIDAMINKIEGWSGIMQQHSERASQTAHNATSLTGLMLEVAQANARLESVITEIAQSSDEQQQILQTANTHLNAVSQVTDESKDGASHLMSQADALSEQISRLTGIAKTFS